MANNRKSTLINSKYISLALISFLLGSIITYLVITSTNYIPLNYEKKFKQIYDAQVRDRGWETYVDLVSGYIVNYPKHYYINSGAYTPLTKGDGGLFHISNGKESDLAYRTTINLLRYRYDGKNLMGFARDNASHHVSATEFHKTTINGNEAVVADFTMTEELYKKLTDLYSLNPKGVLEPVGLKRRRVYIQNNGFVYILQSGSLFADTEIERFDKVLHSFKFLY